MSYFLFGLVRTRRAAGNHHLVPRIVVQTIVSIPLLCPAISYGLCSRSSRSHPRSRDQPIANHRAGLILMKVSCSIDFDRTLVPLFFPTSLFRCPGFLQPFRCIPRNRQRSLSLSLSVCLSVSFCDELAELTGCKHVVQKHTNRYIV